MNSAGGCPNNTASSLRSSRMKTSAAETVVVRNCPPLPVTAACACVMGSLCVDSLAAGKYKPDNVPTINELFRLDGRIAIVTGGSRGIGQEMAEGLAEAGASLMLCARRGGWLGPTVAVVRGEGFQGEGLLA